MVISWLAVSILGVAAFFPLIAIVSLPTFKALMMTVVTICPFLVNTMGYIFGLTVLHSKALLASLGLGILVSSVSAFFTSFQMYKADPKRKILTNELEQRQKIQLDEELEWHKIKKLKILLMNYLIYHQMKVLTEKLYKSKEIMIFLELINRLRKISELNFKTLRLVREKVLKTKH